MSNARLEVLIWVLIYGGLLILSLGLFVGRADPSFGLSLMALGAVVAGVGAALIVLRSRRPEDGPPS